MSLVVVFLQLVLLPFPWFIRRICLRGIMKYEIHPSARIGLSIILSKSLTMEAGSRIGHLTIAKGLAEIHLRPYARVGNLNWITGFPLGGGRFFLKFPRRYPALLIEEHGCIVHRNIIDCTDTVRIGAFSLIAGNRNQILTHSIDVRTSNQACAPVAIGRYCFVGTGSILLKGSCLADYCILAAGSVLHKAHDTPLRLLSGVPAVPVKELDANLGFFKRRIGESDIVQD